MSTDSSGMATNASQEAPYISSSESLPEITFKALVLGFILSAILAGANAYLGLKVGITVSASIPAAVISMAVLRFFRESNILENNVVQTAASAGESLAAGVIFTIPALIMLNYWSRFEFLPTLIIAMCGGILGVLFTIPLRRALIIEANLKFPEGVATAEVLKAGTEGGAGAKLIGIAALASALLKLSQTGFKLIAGRGTGSFTAGNTVFGFGSELGMALLAVGYIVGINIAALVFIGGLISWLFGIPIYTSLVDPAALRELVGDLHGYELAEQVWSQRIRYMGVGAMATGGIWALIALIKPIRDGVRSSIEAVKLHRSGGASDVPRTERDTPINYVGVGIVLMAIPIFIGIATVVNQDALGITSGLYWGVVSLGLVFALIAGFLFSSVAGYMAGLVGSSNNPISGVTIATILTISFILLMLLGGQIDFLTEGTKATAAAATAILVGGVVCCAAAIAGDNMQDLKAGRILGATPYKQQIMQVVGVVAAAIVIAPILQLLFSAYGLGDVFPRAGMDPSEALSAPQATLMSSVANGVFTRNLPWNMIVIGIGIAIAIIIMDEVLKAKKANFRTPVLAVAVGIYLPLELTVPMFIGGIVSLLAVRMLRERGASEGEITSAGTAGLLFSSGLITGEALVGILLAIPFAAAQNTDVIRLAPEGFETFATVLGIVSFGLFTVWLYKVATKWNK